MESEAIQTAGSIEIRQLLYSIIVGGCIVPLVEWLKRTRWMGDAVDPSFVAALLSVGAAYVVTLFTTTHWTHEEVVQFAFGAMSGATLLYRGGKLYVSVKEKGREGKS